MSVWSDGERFGGGGGGERGGGRDRGGNNVFSVTGGDEDGSVWGSLLRGEGRAVWGGRGAGLGAGDVRKLPPPTHTGEGDWTMAVRARASDCGGVCSGR